MWSYASIHLISESARSSSRRPSAWTLKGLKSTLLFCLYLLWLLTLSMLPRYCATVVCTQTLRSNRLSAGEEFPDPLLTRTLSTTSAGGAHRCHRSGSVPRTVAWPGARRAPATAAAAGRPAGRAQRMSTCHRPATLHCPVAACCCTLSWWRHRKSVMTLKHCVRQRESYWRVSTVPKPGIKHHRVKQLSG